MMKTMKKIRELVYELIELVLPIGMVVGAGCGFLLFWALCLAIPAAIVTGTVYGVLHLCGVL